MSFCKLCRTTVLKNYVQTSFVISTDKDKKLLKFEDVQNLLELNGNIPAIEINLLATLSFPIANALSTVPISIEAGVTELKYAI